MCVIRSLSFEHNFAPLALGHQPGQSEVANPQVAVGVDQEVGGLQVPVQHVGRVDVLHAAKNLEKRIIGFFTETKFQRLRFRSNVSA